MNKPCVLAGMSSSPSAGQNDNIFQSYPMDKHHHADTAMARLYNQGIAVIGLSE